MAKPEGVQALIGGLDPDLKKVIVRVFDYVLKNLRLGRPEGQSENLQANFVTGTTASIANTAFSVLHGRESAPYLAVPVLDLQTTGSRTPPLEVTQAADGVRIYLKSSETSKAFVLLVEGP